MSGLKELIQKERIEDEVTSTVPKAKSDYLENYEPSAAKGLAGIAIAGAGAFALRNPIGRAISKLTNLKTPKAPVSRNTAPVIDEVDEVLTIAPTRVERGRELVKLSEQEQIRQEAITRSNELKKIAYMNPLSRGGKTNRIGSSLWDYIARHPIAGARKAGHRTIVRSAASLGKINFVPLGHRHDVPTPFDFPNGLAFSHDVLFLIRGNRLHGLPGCKGSVLSRTLPPGVLAGRCVCPS